MKTPLATLLFIGLVVLVGCKDRSGDHHGEHGGESGPNQALYDEVMNIHDEVMPKMNDLYKAKAALTKQLNENPDLSDDEKQEIRDKIARIDSASEGMMVWMRQFDPLPDSLGEEKAKAYLEGELIKVKQVREDILEVLESTPR